MIGMRRLVWWVVSSTDLLSLTVDPRACVCTGAVFLAGNESANTRCVSGLLDTATVLEAVSQLRCKKAP